LEGDAYAQNVEQDLLDARLAGVSSVPFFLFENNFSVTGARPVEEFARLLEGLTR
jgi:predicted DsbA family dithiol-disulfide isomerase